MKFSFFIGLILMQLTLGKIARANATYVTSTGAVFTQVSVPGKFGSGWQDPSGTIWSGSQGFASNEALVSDKNAVVTKSPASEICKKISGTLPTKEDYLRLFSYFDSELINNFWPTFTDQGRKDLYLIFPDMNHADYFWTASLRPECTYYAFLFPTWSGDVEHSSQCMGFPGWREPGNAAAVRCVTR